MCGLSTRTLSQQGHGELEILTGREGPRCLGKQLTGLNRLTQSCLLFPFKALTGFQAFISSFAKRNG